MSLAPVIIFAYNRPNHLKATLDALAKNELAEASELFIFCDGPKPGANKEQLENISRVRETAHGITGFKSVEVIESEHNKGLANSIIGGVSTIIGKYGKVIVLEDDLLTSRFFLKYMNMALDKYENRPGVMSVSANRPPLSKMEIPHDYPYDVFVSLRSYSTGWGTWSDRWKRVDWTMSYLPDFISHPKEMAAFNRSGDDMTEMLLMQRDGKIDSWAIQFCFAHFREHMVAILPCYPYVDNIGFDGTGVHSGINESEFRNDLSLSVEDPRMPDLLYEDRDIINAFYNYYCRKKRPFWKRVCNYVARRSRMKIPFILKDKVLN